MPKTNDRWWKVKIEQKRRRNNETTAELEGSDLRVMRFGEHEAPNSMVSAIAEELDKTNGECADG